MTWIYCVKRQLFCSETKFITPTIPHNEFPRIYSLESKNFGPTTRILFLWTYCSVVFKTKKLCRQEFNDARTTSFCWNEKSWKWYEKKAHHKTSLTWSSDQIVGFEIWTLCLETILANILYKCYFLSYNKNYVFQNKDTQLTDTTSCMRVGKTPFDKNKLSSVLKRYQWDKKLSSLPTCEDFWFVVKVWSWRF